jgi:hypothetical protein
MALPSHECVLCSSTTEKTLEHLLLRPAGTFCICLVAPEDPFDILTSFRVQLNNVSFFMKINDLPLSRECCHDR